MNRLVTVTGLCAAACAAVLGAAAAAGSGTPLPAPRVDVSGWSPTTTYVVGQVVGFGFAFRNRTPVRLKVVEVRMTLPAGWKVVATLPRPVSSSGSTVVWRYTNLAARRGIKRLRVTLQVGGKPGSACLRETVRATRPRTSTRTTRGCNHVVDSVFH